MEENATENKLIVVNTKDIDSTEFGIEEKKAKSITDAFLLKETERNGYIKVFENLINQEMTPEVAEQAARLGKDLVKVRTGIDKVHKVEKAYYLAAGRYCDALKNKLTLSVEQMEERCEEMANYYVNQEKERLDGVEKARKELLLEEFPEVNFLAYDIRNMDSDSFNQLMQDQYDLKELREEKLRKELDEHAKAEAKAILSTERYSELSPFSSYIEDFDNLDLGEMEETAYNMMLHAAKGRKQEADEKQAKTEAENLRLKQEAEFHKKAEEEREHTRKQMQELQDTRLQEILKYNNPETNQIDLSKLWELSAQDYNTILTNKKTKWEAAKAEQEAAAKKAADEKAKKDAELAKLQKEKEDREAAEKQKKAEEEAAAKKAAAAPRKEKLKDWVNKMHTNTPQAIEDDEVVKLVNEKFNLFVKWALAEIEKI